MDRSMTRRLFVPYTFKFGSTTPCFSRGSIEQEPAVSMASALVVVRKAEGQ